LQICLSSGSWRMSTHNTTLMSGFNLGDWGVFLEELLSISMGN
jgi:hypothetical protein